MLPFCWWWCTIEPGYLIVTKANEDNVGLVYPHLSFNCHMQEFPVSYSFLILPSSWACPWYGTGVSPRRNTWPRGVRCPTSWSPVLRQQSRNIRQTRYKKDLAKHIVWRHICVSNAPGHIPDHPPWKRALSSAPRFRSFPSSCFFLLFPCSSASWSIKTRFRSLVKLSNCLFETQILLVASPKSEHKMQDGTSLNLWIMGVRYLA